MRTEEGIRSRPAAQLHFREVRASSHHALRGGGREGKGRWRRPSTESSRGWRKVEELTEAKCVLRVLAIEAESKLKESQLPEEVGEVASSRVFQIAEGCDFLLISRLK